MYDWANSAFSTTVGTVFLGPYLAALAEAAAKASPDGMARFLGRLPLAPVATGDGLGVEAASLPSPTTQTPTEKLGRVTK